MVAPTIRGTVMGWTKGKTLRWARAGDNTIHGIEGEASFLSLAALPNGDVLVAGERDGPVFVAPLM